MQEGHLRSKTLESCPDAWRHNKKSKLEISDIKKYIMVQLGKKDWVFFTIFS